MNHKQPFGILYIVATPIGNLSDISFRAIETLKKVSLIAAEDTRDTQKLLSHYNISNKTISYHKFNEKKRVSFLLETLFDGKDIAVVSDAGTPCISDPSSIIVKECILNNIKVCPIPGATAFVPALVGSGLDCSNFYFIGFLPNKQKDKQNLFTEIKNLKCSLIFYVSVHKVEKFLREILENLGDRNISIARELSKIYESFYREKISFFIENLSQITLKGEFVIVVEGEKNSFQPSQEELIKELKELILQGESKKSASNIIANKYSIPKKIIYKLSIDL